MKLNNKGWGYKTFIMCMAFISMFVLIASHYLQIFMGVINK